MTHPLNYYKILTASTNKVRLLIFEGMSLKSTQLPLGSWNICSAEAGSWNSIATL